MRATSRLIGISFVVLVLLFLPVDWADAVHAMQWGTVPEWIGAAGIVILAAGVWRVAHDRSRRVDALTDQTSALH